VYYGETGVPKSRLRKLAESSSLSEDDVEEAALDDFDKDISGAGKPTTVRKYNGCIAKGCSMITTKVDWIRCIM
jgi:hypothetical protein